MRAQTGLWWPLERAPAFDEIERAIRAGELGLCVTGLVEGARALLAQRWVERGAGRFLLVASDDAAVDAALDRIRRIAW